MYNPNIFFVVFKVLAKSRQGFPVSLQTNFSTIWQFTFSRGTEALVAGALLSHLKTMPCPALRSVQQHRHRAVRKPRPTTSESALTGSPCDWTNTEGWMHPDQGRQEGALYGKPVRVGAGLSGQVRGALLTSSML